MSQFVRENKTFLIILFISVAVRLVNINMPLLEGTATRQIQTAMVAKNLFANGFNIFYTQVDFLGPGPGYFVIEFPLLNFIVALLYKLCGGVHEWIGRFVSISFFTGSAVFLFFLVKKLFEERTALVALIIFSASPLGLIYSRAFMPDFEMIFFFMGALFFMFLWSGGEKNRYFWLSAVFAMMAILSKVQSFCIFIPLLVLIWQRQRFSFLFRVSSWAYLLIVSVPVVTWYLHAASVHQINSHAGDYSFQDMTYWINPRLFISPKFYITIFEHGWMQMLTPVGFTLFLFGLFIKTTSRQGTILWSWLTGIVVYVIVFCTHMDDPYYNLLFLPITSVFAAVAVKWIWQYTSWDKVFLQNRPARILGIILLLVLVGRYAAYAYTVPRGYRHIPSLARTIEQITNKNDLLVTSIPDGRATLYYSKRKGWWFELPGNDPVKMKKAVARLEDLQQKGAKYFVSVREDFLDRSPDFRDFLRSRYVLVKEEPDVYSIFLIKL